MFYSVRKHSDKPKEVQLTWEDIIAGAAVRETVKQEDTTTYTYKVDHVEFPERGSSFEIREFERKYEKLYSADKTTLYKHYSIPKKTGGYRPIDDPSPELREAFDEMVKLIRMIQGGDLYTTAAYAYVKGRSPLDCARRHNEGNPNYILHMDLHNFFGGITLDFIVEQLKKVNPWASLDESTIRNFFKLCILNGGLPQGTQVSPLLSNLVCVEMDYILMHWCYDHKVVYTRYADDLYFSSLYPINIREIENLVDDWIKNSKATFCRNKEKQHYGSTRGKSYILGVLVTKDHGVKLGNQRVRLLKAALFSCLMDYKAGNTWTQEDIQQLNGELSWFTQVDPTYAKKVIEHLEQKTKVKFKDVRKAVRV